MVEIPQAAQDHYGTVQGLQLLTLAAGRRAWQRVDPRFLSASWDEALQDLVPVVTAAQVRAAYSGSSYGAATLAQQGSWVVPEAFVDPRAFGGYASDGRSLEGLLLSPMVHTKTALTRRPTYTDDDIFDGMTDALPMAQALARGQSSLDTILRTTIADAARQAAGVDTTSRRGVGYIRMLNPPSCIRCAVLAGRFYRWNAGFQRHPKCDCVHVQSRVGSTEAAKAEGLIEDPMEYFNSLSSSEQDKLFGVANSQAIRDGADMSRVSNAYRGKSGLTTTEGTTRRGFASNMRGQRLTPEGIYKTAGSREEALRLLEQHGYTYPGGKSPKPLEGYGALGRGGQRVGARSVVDEARRTGVRDGSRYTMTAAERRVVDSEQRYLAVLQGRNPYDRNGRGLTPTISAQVETDYRRWLASGGQVFTT